MASYSDAELELLIADLESDCVERKESAADGRKIRRNICAFANDLPGNGRPGVVLIGVRDDGTCASLPIDDELLVRLSNIRGEGDILPLPSMTVQKRHLNGCDVAVVTSERGTRTTAIPFWPRSCTTSGSHSVSAWVCLLPAGSSPQTAIPNPSSISNRRAWS